MTISNQRGWAEPSELLILFALIAIVSAIAIPLFVHYRSAGYVKEIRSDLIDATDAQELYFAKNIYYKSCAPCTARNLPGYDNNPKVTLVAEGGRGEFVLTATHENCGGSEWTYQSTTGTITDPSDGCI